MRSLTICLVVFLAACGGISTTEVVKNIPSKVPKESTEVAALQAQINTLNKALGDATHVQALQAEKLSRVTLFAELPSMAKDTLGRSVDAVGNLISFGPCSDPGIQIGRGTSATSDDPLSAPLESYQTCTGYEYSIDMNTGFLAVAPRVFWDGPNCTGNVIEWGAGGGGYNSQSLTNGVVFTSPVDGAIYMVKSGQTPQPIQIQSAWVAVNPGCQTDVEVQMMYVATPNDVSVSGVPSVIGSKFQLTGP